LIFLFHFEWFKIAEARERVAHLEHDIKGVEGGKIEGHRLSSTRQQPSSSSPPSSKDNGQDENQDGRHNQKFVALMERLVKLWEVLGSTPNEQVIFILFLILFDLVLMCW